MKYSWRLFIRLQWSWLSTLYPNVIPNDTIPTELALSILYTEYITKQHLMYYDVRFIGVKKGCLFLRSPVRMFTSLNLANTLVSIAAVVVRWLLVCRFCGLGNTRAQTSCFHSCWRECLPTSFRGRFPGWLRLFERLLLTADSDVKYLWVLRKHCLAP